MMNDRVDIALLEQYLSGEIEVDAVRDVDGKALSKEEVEAAANDYRQLELDIEGAALKAELQAMHGQLDFETQSKRGFRWWTAAAIVLVLTVAGIFALQQSNKAPVFEDYFVPFEQLVTTREGNDNALNEGLAAYSRGNYEQAYQELNALITSNASEDHRFFLAVSALATNHLDTAISQFKLLGTEKDNRYYQQTRWYLALSYWQNGQINEAKKLWSEIKEGQEYFDEAQLLLERL